VDECPSDDDLRRFLDDGGAGVAVGPHLGECERCREAIDRLGEDGSLRDWAASLAAKAEKTEEWDDGDALARVVASLGERAPTAWGQGPGATRDIDLDAEATAATLLGPPAGPGDLGSLGPYAVEAEIGRGGMGVVYRARDRTMNRALALKVLRPGLIDDRGRRRFVQEVRAAARVEHDHIVRLYATSDPTDRVPYFAMEYLAGPSLAGLIHGRDRPSPRGAAGLIAQAADGLAAAHEAGLVHRDVKPANILIDPATGRAKIGDFGLARLASDAPEVSREGLIAGTPSYLSPEQARGEAEVGPASDVYSLGVTFYECLAGEPPFRGSPHRVIQQVLQDDPRPPRTLNDAVPRDLETICLKAMAKEPDRRYTSAADLADDLRRFLRGEPIRARPAGAVERSARWCRRNPRVAGLAAAVGLLLAALAGGSTVSALWIARERGLAVAEARRAVAQRSLALDAFETLIGGVQERLRSRPGTLELRKALLETARDGLAKVADAGDPRADPRILTALIQIGDLDLILGRTGEARAGFERAAAAAARFVEADPRSVPVRAELAAVNDRLGDLAFRGYEPKRALDPFGKSLAIRRALAAERPDDPLIRRGLRVSLNKRGDARQGSGDPEGARADFEESLALLKAEPEAADPAGRARTLADLRFSYTRLGLLAYDEADGPRSLEALRLALAQAETLVALDPENPAWRRERAMALGYLATASRDYGDLAGAEAHLQAFLADRAAAAAADPSDLEARRFLALAHQHIGDLHARRREFDPARAAYLAARDLFEDLARRDPASVLAHKDRLFVLRKLQLAEADAVRYDEAARWARRELEILTGPGVPPHGDLPTWVDKARFYLTVFEWAGPTIDKPAVAFALPREVKHLLLANRAIVLARRGRHAEAAAAAKEVLALKDDPTMPPFAARAYALAAESLPADRADLRSTYVAAAVESLRLAAKADPKAARRWPYELDLEALRDDPGYRAMVEEARAARR